MGVVLGVVLYGTPYAIPQFLASARGDVTAGQLMRGVGQIAAMLFLSQAVVRSVPPEDAGDASGLFNAVRNLGGSFALAGNSIMHKLRMWFPSRRMEETLRANSVAIQDYVGGLGQQFGTPAAGIRLLGRQIQGRHWSCSGNRCPRTPNRRWCIDAIPPAAVFRVGRGAGADAWAGALVGDAAPSHADRARRRRAGAQPLDRRGGVADPGGAGAIEAAARRAAAERQRQYPYLRAQLPGVSLDSSGGGDGDSRSLDFFNLGAAASWEVDLFGGGRSGVEQSRATVGAGIADLADAQVSLSAQVAQAYVNLRDIQARIRLAKQTTVLQQRQVALARQRYEYLNQLAVLTGRTPGAFDGTLGTVVAVPPFRSAGCARGRRPPRHRHRRHGSAHWTRRLHGLRCRVLTAIPSARAPARQTLFQLDGARRHCASA